MKTTILIGYDGSDAARHAITYARDLFTGQRALIVSAWEGWPPMVRERDEEVSVDAERVEKLAAEGVERPAQLA
jgi:hypothetical protein